jgi:hypothetical protein
MIVVARGLSFVSPICVMKRLIWCSTETDLIYGEVLPGQEQIGTVYQLQEVSLAEALQAFERFLASPGSYSLETKEGCRIDFVYQPSSKEVFLDTWFSEGNIEDALIPLEQSEPLIRLIFQDTADAEIAAFLQNIRIDK